MSQNIEFYVKNIDFLNVNDIVKFNVLRHIIFDLLIKFRNSIEFDVFKKRTLCQYALIFLMY